MEEKWFIGGLMAFVCVIFGGLFAGVAYSDHLKHVQKVECIKSGGQVIQESCIRK